MRLHVKGLKTKKKWCVGIGLLVLLLLGLLIGYLGNEGKLSTGVPVLTIETPQKINLTDTEEVVLDVTISSMGEVLYPAFSMSISFDPSRLEFMGVEEGNVFVRGGESGLPRKLPEFSCNPDQCNKTGKINIMYLDTTGGKNAFSQEFLEEEDNVVLRLRFRLRGSLRKGDVCDLTFEDAVFAASNEEESLAMARDTLRVRNSKIVIGE